MRHVRGQQHCPSVEIEETYDEKLCLRSELVRRDTKLNGRLVSVILLIILTPCRREIQEDDDT